MSRLLVLLVEDNGLNRRLFLDLLTFRGHDVIEAVDAPEATARLDEFVPDVVLLDIGIPGKGETVIRFIRERDVLRELPVIAVTAQAMPSDRLRFEALGFDAYISKPINTRTFVGDVEEVVRAKRTPSKRTP